MADEIRNRRFNTEMDNIDKINKELIQVERTTGFLGNGTVLQITFNLKDHPYNPKLLRDNTQSMMSMEDAEGDDDHKDNQNDDEDVDAQPIDECEDRVYNFDLMVPKRFPFVFPELRARCDFVKPSILDERDLMEDMLGKQWHPFIILREIIEKIPQYVYKLKQREKEGTLYFESQANYNLNAVYDLLTFKENQEINKSFACNIPEGSELAVVRKKKRDEEIKRLEEDAKQNRPSAGPSTDSIESVTDDKYKKYLTIVSDNSLLLFERPPFENKKENDDKEIDYDPEDLKFTHGKLILWGTITSIEQLKRNMEFKDKISVVWSKPVKNEDDFHFEYEGEDDKELEEDLDLTYETTIEVPNSDEFMITVLDKMNAIKENTNELKKHHILSADVTSDSVKSKNIDNLLHKITVFEKEFESKKDKEFASDLMELYRKAIEYYSALNDETYKVYLDKNSKL